MNILSSLPRVFGFFRSDPETLEKRSGTPETVQGKLLGGDAEYVSDYPRVTKVGDYLRKNGKPLVYITKDRKKMVKERPNGEVLECPYDDETGKMGEFVQVKPGRAGT